MSADRGYETAADTWLNALLDRSTHALDTWARLNPVLAAPGLAPVAAIPITTGPGPGRLRPDPACPAWGALTRRLAPGARLPEDLALPGYVPIAGSPWRVVPNWRSGDVVLLDATDRLRRIAAVPAPSARTWVTHARRVPAWHAATVLETYAGLAGCYDDETARLRAALALAR